MRENLVFLQNLQDTYANWAEVAIIICNLEGDLITNVSWGNDFAKQLYEKYIKRAALRTFIKPLQTINQSIVLDTDLGTKVIVSPVILKDKITHFIISSYFVDEQTNKVNEDYLKMNNPLFKQEFGLDVLSNEEIINKIESIIKMMEVIASYVELYEKHSRKDKFTKIISEKIISINEGTSTIDSILAIGKYFDNVDFMGVALKLTENIYKVETSIGEYSNYLNGYQFSVGEGLLGYSIAVKQPQFYKNIKNDARIFIFIKMNMDVISLFCFPIIKGNTVIGLLFGGSIKQEIEKKHVYDKLSIWASLMNNHLWINHLQSKRKKQMMEVTTLEEFINVLTNVKDINKVLRILIDICMNFTRGDFASIVFRRESHTKRAEIISRGLSEEEINDYCLDAAKKYFFKKVNISDLDEPFLNETPWGVNVMEFPLIQNFNIFGVLFVGIRSDIEVGEYKSYISTLSTAARIVIYLLSKEKNDVNISGFIELYQKIIKKYDPEKFELAERIRNTTLEFAQGIEMLNLQYAESLSLLAVYDRSFVESFIDNQQLLYLIRKYYEVLEENSDGNIIAELVAVVWTYYSNNESIESIESVHLVNDQIKQQFLAFINRSKIIEQEITLIENKIMEESMKVPSLVDKLDEFSLTNREKEVLNEVVKGYSNKKIAEILHISDHTVKNHITNLLRKLNVSDRSQAIAKVYQVGYTVLK